MSGQNTGIVTLVGAGPGDPDLLTIGALRALERAEVVVFDNLICPEILEHASAAELIDVGKLPFGKQTAQETINGILVREGSLGRNVVRLKGGDPFIFGRGTEEIEALHRAGVPFRVIPGVTSLNGVLGSAGVALTSRGRNRGFAVFTGAGVSDASEFKLWAEYPGPVVVYMGIHRAQEIATQFIASGRSPSEPVTIVVRGGTPREVIAETTLAELPTTLSDPSEWTPGIIAIGVSREHAFRARPLDGKLVVLGKEPLDGPASDTLRALGARPVRGVNHVPVHPFAREIELPARIEGR
ncbi:MAG: uroporphyrinogen-III C-methyltransferase [Planctomycetes bacterium]|nr:uroporphyrinogen-III C-methyltransferase [Planctomycetota bacterium]MCA8937409.1 uroporphyrinogen-III C-methyltransferase [Planctomycetota bacterium]